MKARRPRILRRIQCAKCGKVIYTTSVPVLGCPDRKCLAILPDGYMLCAIILTVGAFLLLGAVIIGPEDVDLTLTRVATRLGLSHPWVQRAIRLASEWGSPIWLRVLERAFRAFLAKKLGLTSVLLSLMILVSMAGFLIGILPGMVLVRALGWQYDGATAGWKLRKDRAPAAPRFELSWGAGSSVCVLWTLGVVLASLFEAHAGDRLQGPVSWLVAFSACLVVPAFISGFLVALATRKQARSVALPGSIFVGGFWFGMMVVLVLDQGFPGLAEGESPLWVILAWVVLGFAQLGSLSAGAWLGSTINSLRRA